MSLWQNASSLWSVFVVVDGAPFDFMSKRRTLPFASNVSTSTNVVGPDAVGVRTVVVIVLARSSYTMSTVALPVPPGAVREPFVGRPCASHAV